MLHQLFSGGLDESLICSSTVIPTYVHNLGRIYTEFEHALKFTQCSALNVEFYSCCALTLVLHLFNTKLIWGKKNNHLLDHNLGLHLGLHLNFLRDEQSIN